jgi:hypothetical protein
MRYVVSDNVFVVDEGALFLFLVIFVVPPESFPKKILDVVN